MKKLIALLLVFVMAFGLTACGNAKEGSENTDFETPAEQWDGALPLVQEGEDNVITIGIRTNTNVTDYNDNAYTHWLEEQTGVDVQFVQFAGSAGDAATQISLMMASGEKLPDILYDFNGIKKAMGEEYGRDGYFLNVKDYFDHYSFYQKQSFRQLLGDEWEPIYNNFMSRASSDGNIYCFPAFGISPLDFPKFHPWINTRWLEALKLEAPTNIEELYDVLVAFRDGDPNGNGKKDEIPMIGIANDGFADCVMWVINAFQFINMGSHYNVTDDGTVWLPYDTDEYRQALQFLNKLVKEGLLSKLTWTISPAENEALINATATGDYTVGVICGHADTQFIKDGDAIYAYDPLPPLADATGSGGYGPQATYSQSYVTYITADCENPLLAFKLLDFMCSQESFLRQRYGEYGVDWRYVDGGLGHLGGEAKIELLNPNFYNEQNNGSWRGAFGVSSEWDWEQLTDPEADPWNYTKNMKLVQNYEYSEAAGQPKNVYYAPAYTLEENEIRNAVKPDVEDYLKVSRAEFCTGVRDPYSDADWQSYLDALKALGYYDDFLTPAQSAWDRING